MIIDEVTLQDIGVYAGRQSIVITPPSDEKPITLIGGLNGLGKTTLLNSIQLCLYGKQSSFFEQSNKPYANFLKNLIHRGNGSTSAAVCIVFRFRTNGQEDTFKVTRSWSLTGKTCKEHFEVLKNESFDEIASEHWAEHVEKILPRKIAPLFFFDGEKIANYADPQKAPEMIRTAIHGLLGLDTVDQLLADLQILERRKITQSIDQVQKEKLQITESEVKKLRSSLDKSKQKLAHLKTITIRGQEKLLEKAEAQYNKQGGKLFENKTILENSLQAEMMAKEDVEFQLNRLAKGILPFSMNQELLSKLSKETARTGNILDSQKALLLLKNRNATLISFLQKRTKSKTLVKATDSFLEKELSSTTKKANEVIRITPSDLSKKSLANLQSHLMGDVADEARRLASRHRKVTNRISSINTQIDSVPTEDAIEKIRRKYFDLLTSVAATKNEVLSSEAGIDKQAKTLERAQNSLTRLYEKIARDQLSHDDVKRLVRFSERSRASLEEFRERVVKRHLSKIEKFVLNSFKHLLHKSALVSNMIIDPETFRVTLFDGKDKVFGIDQLSAGERQLFSIAILWGLAKASGRPLPIIIDTPLGRLDKAHRENLIKSYFPFVSHQVLLLSTDEEIGSKEKTELEAYTGHEYILEFNEASNSTQIHTGYFESMEQARGH